MNTQFNPAHTVYVSTANVPTDILQTPWLHLDKGHLQRDFEYQTGVVNIFGMHLSMSQETY